MSTLHRLLAYVCAPYAGDVGLNVMRAGLIARCAVYDGRAPICVHPMIPVLWPGDETPKTRATGLDCTTAIVYAVARMPVGELWILLSDNGRMTERMALEWREWCDVRGIVRSSDPARARGVRVATWAGWEQSMKRTGFAQQWCSLSNGVRDRPTGPLGTDGNEYPDTDPQHNG